MPKVRPHGTVAPRCLRCRLGRISRAGVASEAVTVSGKAAGVTSCWGLVLGGVYGRDAFDFYPVIEFVWSTVRYHECSAASNLFSRGRAVTVFAHMKPGANHEIKARFSPLLQDHESNRVL